MRPNSRPLIAGILLASVVGSLLLILRVRPVAEEDIQRIWKDGDQERALMLIEQLLEDDPTSPNLNLLKGQMLLSSNPEAARDALQIAATDPQRGLEAKKLLAGSAMVDGRYSDALKNLEDLLNASPDDPSLTLPMAETLFHLEMYNAALPFAQQAVQLDSTRVENHLLLADILDELDRVYESISPLESAVSLSPENEVARANLAYALIRSGEFDRADEHLQWSLKRNPRNPDLRLMQAQTLRERGQAEEATALLEDLVRDHPDLERARILLAELHLFQRQPEEVLKLLEGRENDSENEHQMLSLLTRAAYMVGDKEKATAFQRQLKQNLDETKR